MLVYLNLHDYGDLAVNKDAFIELSKQYDVVINESVDADILSDPIYRTELIASVEGLLQRIRELLEAGGIGHKIIDVNAYTQKSYLVGLMIFAGGEKTASALKTLGAEITYLHGTTWRGS